MADITLAKNKVIYQSGQPMTALHLITKGRIRVQYPGGAYHLSKGDVIGICEVCSEVHFLSYVTSEETSILTYPLTNMESLDELFQKHPDVARLFLLSSFRQISIILEKWSLLGLSCSTLYQNLTEDFETYANLARRYQLTTQVLESLNSFSAFLSEDLPDVWLNSFYQGLSHIYASEGHKAIIQESAVSVGFLRKCSLDFRKTFYCLDEQYRYIQELSGFYFNESGDDLFTLYSSLYNKLGQDSDDVAIILSNLNRMMEQFPPYFEENEELFNLRIENFKSKLTSREISSIAGIDPDITSILEDSLNTILDFAGEHVGISNSFRQHVYSFKALSDKSSMDDSACALRKAITEEFYILYSALFEQSLISPSIPAPVLLFLYFGYVDEDLAGMENAVTLYQIAKELGDTSDFGLYTFYDWLLAIFNGKKLPSRNEFELDFTDYIHKEKLNGQLSDEQLRDLENNAMCKVNYELRNMFPVVNKITFGRITTFCPLFCADNVLKKLNDCLVSVSALSKALEMVRKTDYSAFYREAIDTQNYDLMGKEMIHTEYLPDIILMPNVGIRGSMWQEIEGKRRNTPGRMMFPIFHLEDFTTTFLQLTAEFRWELCKRIQGSRWNDVSDRSLTSEYFDYIQFYRRNHELGSDAKERLRSGLQRAKNSFKEMFVRDYIVWVMFEGKGSPRLNKVARRILFTYCPFTASICKTLSQNPLYTELLEQQRVHQAQKIHHLNLVKQKLLSKGFNIPSTIEQEELFVEGNVF